MGIMPGAGKSKEDVNYRQHEQCSSCVHFYPPNSCEVVQGNVSPEAVCLEWAIKERDSGPKHAEFYTNEYQKSEKNKGA